MSELRPIQIGDELHGYCGGYFGRDGFACATGPGILRELAQYRKPNPDSCEWGTCPAKGGDR